MFSIIGHFSRSLSWSCVSRLLLHWFGGCNCSTFVEINATKKNCVLAVDSVDSLEDCLKTDKEDLWCAAFVYVGMMLFILQLRSSEKMHCVLILAMAVAPCLTQAMPGGRYSPKYQLSVKIRNYQFTLEGIKGGSNWSPPPTIFLT